MRLLKQLEFAFAKSTIPFGQSGQGDAGIVGQALRLPQAEAPIPKGFGVALQFRGRDALLERQARQLLHLASAAKLAPAVRVQWNPRLQTTAGRADYHEKLISLNPRIRSHGPAEVERTLRHELAHLLAQFRAGRHRIHPHGPEWREACRDLGISDEVRCHNLPFAARTLRLRFIYRCPNCRRDFPRVRRIRRTVACLRCCRAYNHGEFDPRFRLKLVNTCQPVIQTEVEESLNAQRKR